jgi:hypothetical protein
VSVVVSEGVVECVSECVSELLAVVREVTLVEDDCV